MLNKYFFSCQLHALIFILTEHIDKTQVQTQTSLNKNLTVELLITVEGYGGWCGREVRSSPVKPACSCHTHHTRRLHFSPPRSPLMWPSQPRDKCAQTWKTLRLAKNNMLSTDSLSRNANTKCSLCSNYTHFDIDSRGDSVLYIYVNACFKEKSKMQRHFVASSSCVNIRMKG